MRWLAASLAAVCASVLASVALAFPFGGLGPGVAAASLFAGLAVGLLAFRRTAGADPRGKRVLPTGWEWLPIAVFVLFSLRAFCWLIFVDDDDIKILSPNNLGDMAIHLTYINYLASGIHFWPQEPIFPGHPLRYPVGTDLFNSLLLLCHFDLYRGLVWTGLAGCAATGLALYEWGGAFTLAGFLFNGGAWGLAFFLHPRIKDFQADYAWKSIPLAMFVTQRGLLYALPAGLLLLISWRDRFFRGKPGRIPFWLEVLFYGSMPLFHVHTFIFLSLLLGCWAAIGLAPRRPLVALVAWSLVPATVLVGLVCGFSDGGSIVHLVDLTKGGLWTQGSDNFFKYWLGNFGILPVLAALLAGMLLHSRKPEDRQAMAFVLPGAAIFLFACVVILAPWDWDNIKLLLWCYLAVLPFLWRDLLAGRSFPVRAGACAALFFSGFLSLFGGIDASHTGYDLAKRLRAGRPARRDPPAAAGRGHFRRYADLQSSPPPPRPEDGDGLPRPPLEPRIRLRGARSAVEEPHDGRAGLACHRRGPESPLSVLGPEGDRRIPQLAAALEGPVRRRRQRRVGRPLRPGAPGEEVGNGDCLLINHGAHSSPPRL